MYEDHYEDAPHADPYDPWHSEEDDDEEGNNDWMYFSLDVGLPAPRQYPTDYSHTAPY